MGSPVMSKIVDFDKHRDAVRYKPRAIVGMDEFRQEARKLIGDRAKVFRGDGRRFVTFGSCFATNVAEVLKDNGHEVYTTCITEDVNSTFNNRLVLKRVFHGDSCKFTENLLLATGVNYDELRKEFTRATDIIFTLGNVFRLEGGEVVSLNDTRLVKESYEETVACLREIVLMLRTHTKARLFMSVSPIPISGYRGEDFINPIEADCASKCQLRAAVEDVSGFTYIPTFEIFRWFAAHQSFPTFGDGNGNQRHIYRDQINTVMEILC